MKIIGLSVIFIFLAGSVKVSGQVQGELPCDQQWTNAYYCKMNLFKDMKTDFSMFSECLPNPQREACEAELNKTVGCWESIPESAEKELREQFAANMEACFTQQNPVPTNKVNRNGNRPRQQEFRGGFQRPPPMPRPPVHRPPPGEACLPRFREEMKCLEATMEEAIGVFQTRKRACWSTVTPNCQPGRRDGAVCNCMCRAKAEYERKQDQLVQECLGRQGMGLHPGPMAHDRDCNQGCKDIFYKRNGLLRLQKKNN